MPQSIVPVLELPQDAFLMYEHITSDLDRSGNWRYYVRRDGAFVHQRNQQLFVDAAQETSREAQLFWSTGWPENASRTFSGENLAALAAAIDSANFPRLKSYYGRTPAAVASHPSIDRWTVTDHSTTYSVVVEPGSAPAAISKLESFIETLLAQH